MKFPIVSLLAVSTFARSGTETTEAAGTANTCITGDGITLAAKYSDAALSARDGGIVVALAVSMISFLI